MRKTLLKISNTHSTVDLSKSSGPRLKKRSTSTNSNYPNPTGFRLYIITMSRRREPSFFQNDKKSYYSSLATLHSNSNS